MVGVETHRAEVDVAGLRQLGIGRGRIDRASGPGTLVNRPDGHTRQRGFHRLRGVLQIAVAIGEPKGHGTGRFGSSFRLRRILVAEDIGPAVLDTERVRAARPETAPGDAADGAIEVAVAARAAGRQVAVADVGDRHGRRRAGPIDAGIDRRNTRNLIDRRHPLAAQRGGDGLAGVVAGCIAVGECRDDVDRARGGGLLGRREQIGEGLRCAVPQPGLGRSRQLATGPDEHGTTLAHGAIQVADLGRDTGVQIAVTGVGHRDRRISAAADQHEPGVATADTLDRRDGHSLECQHRALRVIATLPGRHRGGTGTGGRHRLPQSTRRTGPGEPVRIADERTARRQIGIAALRSPAERNGSGRVVQGAGDLRIRRQGHLLVACGGARQRIEVQRAGGRRGDVVAGRRCRGAQVKNRAGPSRPSSRRQQRGN